MFVIDLWGYGGNKSQIRTYCRPIKSGSLPEGNVFFSGIVFYIMAAVFPADLLYKAFGNEGRDECVA